MDKYFIRGIQKIFRSFGEAKIGVIIWIGFKAR